jgi:hypothetical protein
LEVCKRTKKARAFVDRGSISHAVSKDRAELDAVGGSVSKLALAETAQPGG